MYTSILSNLIDTQTTAEILGVKPETLVVWRCTKRYDLPYVKIGRKVFYQEGDVKNFIESRLIHHSTDA